MRKTSGASAGECKATLSWQRRAIPAGFAFLLPMECFDEILTYYLMHPQFS